MIDYTNNKRMATEVLEILDHLQEYQVEKIPKSLIEKLNQIKDPSIDINIDDSKKIFEQNVCEETKIMIYLIFRDYIASEKEKNIINQALKQMNNSFDENLSLKNLFNKN